MLSKIYNYWELIKSNLWFVPAMLSAAYCVATLTLYQVEKHFWTGVDLPNVFFTGSVEDAKAVVITLLSSMITMATLAISVTMVALSLAASQLGPRLIRAFMSDRRTKYFIGLFFGSVVSCFILTIALHNASPDSISPSITVTAVFALCFINLFVLLGFFHHVAQSCIADNIIIDVADDLRHSLKRLTTSKAEAQQDKKGRSNKWPDGFDEDAANFYFEDSGYVQHIDYVPRQHKLDR